MALAAAALAGLWLAMWLGGTGPIDRGVYRALYVGGHPQLIAAATGITLLGDPRLLIPAAFASALWLWRQGHAHSALTLLIVTLVGRAVNSVMKLDVGRARPDLLPHLAVEHTNSFPSGHSAGAITFFLALALLLTHRRSDRLRWAAATVAVALAMLVGISRVMLGVHWPSDVVGGWAFGALWVIVTLRLAEDMADRRRLRR